VRGDVGFKMKIRKIMRNPWIMTPLVLALVALVGCALWCRGRIPPRWLVQWFPGNALFERVRTAQTRSDFSRITKAVTRFEEHYGKLPIVQTLHDEQFSITLAHELHGAPPSHSPVNPDGINFSGIPAGLMRDGWDQSYHIMLDRDGDGTVSNDVYVVAHRIAVWSDGPNQTDEQGTGDDIISWKPEEANKILHGIVANAPNREN
jgi:hypothetical protein